MEAQVFTVELPTLNYEQKEVVNSDARFKGLLKDRRSGKGLISRYSCISRMIHGEHCAYVVPNFGLARMFFDEVNNSLAGELKSYSNEPDLVIQLITGGTLHIYTAINIETFRGRDFHYMVIDEAGFIPNLTHYWSSTMLVSLSKFQGNALFIAAPEDKAILEALDVKSYGEWKTF